MLAIGVHEYQDFSRGDTDAAFYGRAVADVIRMAVNQSPLVFCFVTGPIGRTVIDNNDFKIGVKRPDIGNDSPNTFHFIVCGNDNGYIRVFHFCYGLV